jgi:hypothetical protein
MIDLKEPDSSGAIRCKEEKRELRQSSLGQELRAAGL